MRLVLDISFGILSLTTCGYAVIFGGWEGRWLSGMIVCATGLTAIAHATIKPVLGASHALFMVDFPLLIGFLIVAMRTDRYWPLWICAMHLLSVLSYLAFWFRPHVLPTTYQSMEALWSIPALCFLGFGPFLDRAAERASASKERSLERLQHVQGDDRAGAAEHHVAALS